MTILLVRALAGRDFRKLRIAKEVVGDINRRDRMRVELWDLIDLLEELVVLARELDAESGYEPTWPNRMRREYLVPVTGLLPANDRSIGLFSASGSRSGCCDCRARLAIGSNCRCADLPTWSWSRCAGIRGRVTLLLAIVDVENARLSCMRIGTCYRSNVDGRCGGLSAQRWRSR
jgi:hypothetical protein